jgi:hypothetical protein
VLCYAIVRDQKILVVKASQGSRSIGDFGVHMDQGHAGAKCRRFLRETQEGPKETRSQRAYNHSSRISKTGPKHRLPHGRGSEEGGKDWHRFAPFRSRLGRRVRESVPAPNQRTNS